MRFLVTFAILLFVGCSGSRHTAREMASAKEFKQNLVNAVIYAERIEIVEHSYIYDFRDEKGELLPDSPQREYKRTVLSSTQMSELRNSLEQMSDAPKTAFSLCAFQPHHSIEVFFKDGSKSVIEICFACDDTKWDGSKGIAPENFQRVIKEFIEPIGFQTYREWDKLAKEEVEE